MMKRTHDSGDNCASSETVEASDPFRVFLSEVENVGVIYAFSS